VRLRLGLFPLTSGAARGMLRGAKMDTGTKLVLCGYGIAVGVFLIAVSVLTGGAGCAANGDVAGIKSEIKGVEARLSNKENNSRTINQRAIRDAISQENDRWTMRIMAGGLVLLALSVPVGKTVNRLLMWAATRTKRAALSVATKARVVAAWGRRPVIRAAGHHKAGRR